MKALDAIAAVLIIVGAVNWGLVGLAKFNLVTFMLGQTVLASAVFAIVGAAGVFFAARWMTAQRAPLPQHA
jgi:uncharacterized membrane protein YuzA (DUF378 family)